MTINFLPALLALIGAATWFDAGVTAISLRRPRWFSGFVCVGLVVLCLGTAFRLLGPYL